MTNTTGGQWYIDKTEQQLRIRSTLLLKHEYSIALLPPGQKDNAALISAAPDLLEALKAALPLLKAYESSEWKSVLDMAQKAIVKALDTTTVESEK